MRTAPGLREILLHGSALWPNDSTDLISGAGRACGDDI
jgi:hypothetical protein